MADQARGASRGSERSKHRLLHTEGNKAEAELLFRDALRVSRALLGSVHPSTVTVLSNLAASLHEQGKQAEVELLLREALREQGAEPPC